MKQLLWLCLLGSVVFAKEYKLPDGTLVNEGTLHSIFGEPRYYATFTRAVKNDSQKPSTHSMGLDLEKRSYFIACRLFSGTSYFEEVKSGESFSSICSKNEDFYRAYVNRFIETSNAWLQAFGETLINGNIISLNQDGFDTPLVFIVARALTENMQVDSFKLGQKIQELILDGKYGVFEIEGYLVKTTLVASGSIVNVSDLLPPTK